MSADKMREDFESWLKSEWPKAPTLKYKTGDYRSDTVQQSWVAWQASRAAVVVVFPKEFEDETGKPFGQMMILVANAVLSACSRAVVGAGLKVGP